MTAGSTGPIPNWGFGGRLRLPMRLCPIRIASCRCSPISPLFSNSRGEQPMRVLVTGGAGFIGLAGCRRLVLEHGMSVVNIDKLTYAANLRSLDSLAGDPAYAFEQVDICDRADVDGVFAKYQPGA